MMPRAGFGSVSSDPMVGVSTSFVGATMFVISIAFIVCLSVERLFFVVRRSGHKHSTIYDEARRFGNAVSALMNPFFMVLESFFR